MAWFLKRKKWTMEEAVGEVRREMVEEGEVGRKGEDGFGETRFVEIGNGESRVLE